MSDPVFFAPTPKPEENVPAPEGEVKKKRRGVIEDEPVPEPPTPPMTVQFGGFTFTFSKVPTKTDELARCEIAVTTQLKDRNNHRAWVGGGKKDTPGADIVLTVKAF